MGSSFPEEENKKKKKIKIPHSKLWVFLVFVELFDYRCEQRSIKLNEEIMEAFTTMSMYKYLRDAWQSDSIHQRERILLWRREPTTVRIDHPTRLERARSLGYKAKQGYLIVRQRVDLGGRMRPDIVAGRKPKNNRQNKMLDMNYQHIAERRAYERYAANCEVMNSYLVGDDGKQAWYEVILVDKTHPIIQADERVNGLIENRARVMRGLTMAGRRSRGLLHKGTGAEKLRPSRTANRKRRMRARIKKEGLNLQTEEIYPRHRR